MNNERNPVSERDEQNNTTQNANNIQHINPFDKEQGRVDKKTMEEEVIAEQQRKGALTERD